MPWSLLPPGDQLRLAQGIRERDPEAEEAFVRLFGERIGVMMLVRTREAEAARELTQEVLLAAWRAIRDGQLRDPERLAAFVHGIARNVVNNYRRVRAQRPQFEPIDDGLRLAAAEPRDDPDRRALVARALTHLSAEDRQVLLLTLVRGLKPRDIAVRLGLGAEVVRARKSRAIKRLMDTIAQLSRIVPGEH